MIRAMVVAMLLMAMNCSCNILDSTSEKVSSITSEERDFLNKTNEKAVEKETGVDAITAPVEVYDQYIPGIPIWPGVRFGGISKKVNVIPPPVDAQQSFEMRMTQHRIEQRVYWSSMINKGIMLGFVVGVIGIIIRVWAELRVGSRIAVGGFGFLCLCVACQWYFDYIPYIAVGFVLLFIVYMIWEIYDEKSDDRCESELAATVEILKEKIRDKNLGHLWEEAKEEVLHSKFTEKKVASFKKRVEKIKKSVEEVVHRKMEA
jgi:hypothetical protein